MGDSMMFRSLPFLRMIFEATFKSPFFINFSNASTILFQCRRETNFNKKFSPTSNSKARRNGISTESLERRSKFDEQSVMFSRIFQEREVFSSRRCLITSRKRFSSIERSICSKNKKIFILNLGML